MPDPVAVLLLFIMIGPLSVLSAGAAQFRREEGTFNTTPDASVSVSSRFACSAKCASMLPCFCHGFTYHEDGTCGLYRGDKSCQKMQADCQQDPPETTITPSGASGDLPETTITPSGAPGDLPGTTITPSGAPGDLPGTTVTPSGAPGDLPGTTITPSGAPGDLPETTITPSGAPGDLPGTTVTPSGAPGDLPGTTVTPSGAPGDLPGTTVTPSGAPEASSYRLLPRPMCPGKAKALCVGENGALAGRWGKVATPICAVSDKRGWNKSSIYLLICHRKQGLG